MQDEIVTVDGREILIRPMDSAHIVSECAHCRTEGWTSREFRRFHAEMMRRYGNAAIVALCEEKIVGFVNFYPAILNSKLKAPLCPHVDDDLRKAFDQMEWPEEPGDTLSISCVNLDQDLVRRGIGTKLVQKAVEWARENRYDMVGTVQGVLREDRVPRQRDRGVQGAKGGRRDACAYHGTPADRLTPSHELASAFPGWRGAAKGAIEWLWAHRTDDGLWDFGPRSTWSFYFPLSEDWRRKGRRVHDYSTRVLTLLGKYCDSCDRNGG
jgi:GNAT superfamily N-acetyltransferase